MSNIPSELKFLPSHEWIRLEEDNMVVVGISDYAQSALGDLVYVELPEIDAELNASEEAGVVESVKAASDIYAPLTGVVVAVNDALTDSPELVNSDPYGDGWIFQLQIKDVSELDGLLTAEDYAEQLADEDDDA
ncbi:MAG: glycine cleavage system protein GcvH [Gammaproteobacteria bacterium]|jgi:glycine cleavage system H protein